MQSFDNKIKTIKFEQYDMDKNWQRIGRITNESLRTFLAVKNAKIRLKIPGNNTLREYIFKKHTQISIKKNSMLFQNSDIEKLLISSLC